MVVGLCPGHPLIMDNMLKIMFMLKYVSWNIEWLTQFGYPIC